MKILAINPGSTSTKIAVYENEQEIFKRSIDHSLERLDLYERVIDQFAMREEEILLALSQADFSLHQFSAIVGRGGLLPPLHSGAYRVNDHMIEILRSDKISEHASNLGGLLAYNLATPIGIPAFIYDPVSVDEMTDVARISGLKEIERSSFCHVLNSRAMAKKASEKMNAEYSELNIIVAHLGGGISLSIHEKGRLIDVIRDDEGPFSPERSGRIPCKDLVDLCYKTDYRRNDVLKKLRGNGGLKDYLNTHDAIAVERRITDGDQYAKLIYEAMAYQVAKGIGELATVVNGNVDLIVITGGIAHSKMLTEWIKQRVEFIAPVRVMAGENELEALAYGALRVLTNIETALEYPFSCGSKEGRWA
jgi:butyrate kinase